MPPNIPVPVPNILLRPGILETRVPIPLPTPPKIPPKKVPTPGINGRIGATFLATFLIDLNVFFNQPNSGNPVIGLMDIPSPTV